MKTLTKNKWLYIRHWIILIITVEILMLLFNCYLPLIYLIISILFLVGLGLRVLNLYPGKEEPLILDSSAVFIALVLAHTSKWLSTFNIKSLLISISSIIILPHLVYIICKRDI